MFSALRVTLASAGWELQGGEAGQWWSLLLLDAREVSGDRMPSRHHTFLLQQLPICAHFLTRVDWGPDKAMVLVQHDQQSGHFMLCRCGQRLFGVKGSSLHFKLAYLKTQHLSGFHCSVGCHFQPLLWRYFKIVLPVSDLITLSRSHQDCFCFHCRGEGTKECQGSLHLINPFCSLLKCICKRFLWPASCSGGILVQRLLHSLPSQMRQVLKSLTCPNSLPG